MKSRAASATQVPACTVIIDVLTVITWISFDIEGNLQTLQLLGNNPL